MTWDYLEQSPSTSAPGTPAETDWSLTGRAARPQAGDTIATYDRQVSELMDNHHEFVRRGHQVARLLGGVYATEKYACLDRSNVAPLITSLRHYRSMLVDPDGANAQLKLRDTVTRPELATADLAVVSLLRGDPIGSLARYFGWGNQTVYDSMTAAKKYLLANRLLLIAPDGARGLSDAVLRQYGFTSQELHEHGLGDTGLEQIPATLAILAADIVHDEDNPILPLGRAASQAALQQAQAVVDRARQIEDSYKLYPPEKQRLVDYDPKAIERARGVLEDQRKYTIRLSERREIEKAVMLAAERWLGFDPGDTGKVHLAAELLVAAAHDFEPIPQKAQDVRHAIRQRVQKAAAKCHLRERDISSLPLAAQALYRACMA